MANAMDIEKSLELIGRQLTYLVHQHGYSFKESLNLISEQGMEQTANLVEQIADPSCQPKLPKNSPYMVLKDMVRLPGIEVSAVPQLTEAFVTSNKEFRQQVLAYCLSLKNSIFYCAVLAVVGFLVAGIFYRRILPQMVAFQGDKLPEITAFMANTGIYIVFLLLFIALIFVAGLFSALRAMVQSAERFRPVRGWITKIAIVDRLVESVNDYLLVAYCHILNSVKHEAEAALADASMLCYGNRLTSIESLFSDSSAQQIQLSLRLGTFEFELEHLQSTASESLANRLVQFRTGINVGFQVAIFMGISMMIIAFYAAIVNIGNIFT